MKKYIKFFVLASLFLTSCVKEVERRAAGPATDIVVERLVDSLTVINLQYYASYNSFISLGSYSVSNKTDSSITVHGLILQVTDNYNTLLGLLYKNGPSSNLMQIDPISYLVPIEETISPGQSTQKVNIMSVNAIPFNYKPSWGNMFVSVRVKNIISNASTEAPKTDSQISFNVVP